MATRPGGNVTGESWQNTQSDIPNGGAAPSEEELARLKRPLSTQPLRDLPVNVVPEWDNVQLVRRSLTDLEWGRFLSASYLCDAMGRDDRIQGVLATRTNALIGLPFEMRPADQTGKTRKIAEQATELWPSMVDEAQLSQILECGIMMGVAISEKVWTLGEQWTPHLRFWHPSFYYWRWDTRSFWLITQDGQIEVPEDGGGRFVVYAPYGYYRGWMRGRVRSLPLPWLIRTFARRDWARQSEVFGNTIKKAIVPQRADVRDRRIFAASLANLGSEGLIECPELPPQNGETTGQRFDLELVEAEARTWESFEKLIGHAEAAISIAVLGQTLTTEVKEGSKAAATVHASVKAEYQKADATTLSRTIRTGMLADWCQFNFGDRDLAPIPTWQTEPPADVTAKATSLNQAASALKTFVDVGMPVDLDAYADEFHLPLIPEAQRPTPEEIAAQAQPADDEPDDEDEEDPEEDPKADPKAAPKKKSKAKGKAKLSARINSASRAQQYADALAEKARDRAKQVMRRRIELLTQVLHSSKTPAELKKNLAEAFDHPKESELAELVQKAQVMAELAGRHSVLEGQ